MWIYLLIIVALQIILALVAYAMVRLASQNDKADLVDTDDVSAPEAR